MHKYTPKEIRFLENKIAGRSYAEMTTLFNKRFGLSITVNQMSFTLFYHKLANNRCHKYTPKEIRFLESKIAGRSVAETTELFNRHFGLSITTGQIKGFKANRKLCTGRDTRFPPGHVSFNKGRKGVCAAGCEKGWLKPGQMPQTYRPVGTKRTTANGYVEVKIADPDVWEYKHILIWEAAHGAVPKGKVIIFADRNRLNLKLKNLLMISRSELAVMNRWGLIYANADLTMAGKTVADIKIKIADRKRGIKKSKEAQTMRNKRSNYES
jgi:hypothetical protein